MFDDRERRIREIAYAIWQDEGQPLDRGEAHWFRAVEEVDRELTEELQALAAMPTKRPRAKKSPALAPAKRATAREARV